MTIIRQSNYQLQWNDQPLSHARIGHSRNWLKGGTAVVSSTATDYVANGPLNSLTYERWKPTAVPATWEYQHTGAAPVDYCGIAAHSLSGCTIQIEYWTGSAWAAVTPSTVVVDNSPIFCLFSPITAQRWRVNITAGPVPEIGVIKFGRALQMERPLYGGHAPLDLSRQVVFRANESETGETLGRTKIRQALISTYAWKNLTAAWVRTNWSVFQRAVEEEAFFIAWRPSSFGEVGYCQAVGVPIPQNSGTRDLMDVELQVKGFAYD